MPPLGTFFNWPTRSSISRPGLKVTTSLAGTSTCSPVRGLRAFLGLSLLDLEDAEIAKLDAAFLHQRLRDPVKDTLDDLLGLALG